MCRPDQFLLRHLQHYARPDGRSESRHRRAHLKTALVESAHGSAIVRIGQTPVLAGITCKPLRPPEQKPNSGRVTVSLELAATASVAAAAAATRTGGITSGSRADYAATADLVRHAATTGILKLESLCVEPGSLVWGVHCDIHILEDDGSHVDACILALNSSVRDVSLPDVFLSEDDAQNAVSLSDENVRPLKYSPASDTIFAITFGVISGTLVADPTSDEQILMDACFTVLMSGGLEFRGLHKLGGHTASDACIAAAVDCARHRVVALCALLEGGG